MPRTGRPTTTIAVLAAISALATACTGQGADTASDDPKADVTLNFWHGWSAPSEAKAIEDNIARFEKAHPNIKVQVTGNMTDDKINQALRAGGDKAPDVVSSFTTDSVGKFCNSRAFADLNPFLKKSGVDKTKVFPKTLLEYTEFEGNQCTLPLLNDAYGLVYNKTAFAAAGITEPPKTWSQFTEVAQKLTKPKGDSYEQVGLMPTFHGYETKPTRLAAQWGATYFGADGRSNLAGDPAFAKMLTAQKDLVDKLGGYEKLERFRNTFGDEWSAEHPFHTGQVAMQIDGEWRAPMAKEAGVPFEIGTAPLPVPDEQAADYGKGYLAGTIMGIASGSKKQNAAWELVKYMTTDTEAVVAFANAIHNVPSTLAALESPNLQVTPEFKTFLDIARHPKSSTTPAKADGGTYQLTFEDFAYGVEKGDVTDIPAGLAKTDRQIDTDIAKAK
ncbi:ABC transporter substrate-binding protein [Streptomyces virginiae]|uniref:ABC transporter substrate-binding protein n=1 Tax=Streptomyces TaxID=1883 RepID=UPI000525DCDC|nr:MULTISPECIES: ABC transporter substrate-binding protein [Streptomyces]MCX4719478.1 ABC transporter substrate-binding protein [Streptomyces virginiae]MCX5271425.1 ABC transporter substrate-binding protein [Streptomyces virginiae]MYV78371.1 extracellular solute-binding protein [Streptomyces sp. SID1046]WSC77701.1 ABC transporter substrate-binding protein [Streptomyces virginiae]